MYFSCLKVTCTYIHVLHIYDVDTCTYKYKIFPLSIFLFCNLKSSTHVELQFISSPLLMSIYIYWIHGLHFYVM